MDHQRINKHLFITKIPNLKVYKKLKMTDPNLPEHTTIVNLNVFNGLIKKVIKTLKKEHCDAFCFTKIKDRISEAHGKGGDANTYSFGQSSQRVAINEILNKTSNENFSRCFSR